MICVYFNPRSHERSDGDVNKIDCGGSVISIHAPTRGATVFRRAERNSCRISIHAPTRGATHSHQRFYRYAQISIHAPTRGATQPPNIANTTIRFQSTLPREERQKSANRSKQFKHFNPRSHERSDELADQNKYALSPISIHAPTRGATLSSSGLRRRYFISIHAPTRGATGTSPSAASS